MKKKLCCILLIILMLLTTISFADMQVDRVTPVYKSIAAGISHSLAVRQDGSLYTWGDNASGQLGDGTISSWDWEGGFSTENDKSTPVKIMDDVASVAAGVYYSLAVKTDGSLWAWGSKGYGMFGDGDGNYTHPVKIMDDVGTVVSGGSYSLAIKTDNSLWVWGANRFGQLGDGTIINRLNPIKIMDDVAFVAAGGTHSLAIKNDGSLWAWGSNGNGQLGDGTGGNWNDYRAAPVKVMDDVISVAAGGSWSLAIKSDNTLWLWGSSLGLFTYGENINRNTPEKIMDDITKIYAGGERNFVIKTDESLWAWGDNPYGKLGDGTSIPKFTPVKILDNVASVAVGEHHTLAIKSDGSSWAWGGNGNGQLGDGTNTNGYSPVKIIGGSIGVITVHLNGQALIFDQPPIIENDRALVPLRAIFEAIGADIEWNQSTRTVTAVKEKTVITMQIGHTVMTKNGTSITLEVPPTIVNSRTLVPVRAVAEAFDAQVEWDAVNRIVIIESN